MLDPTPNSDGPLRAEENDGEFILEAKEINLEQNLRGKSGYFQDHFKDTEQN